jgi:hypothetical protein
MAGGRAAAAFIGAALLTLLASGLPGAGSVVRADGPARTAADKATHAPRAKAASADAPRVKAAATPAQGGFWVATARGGIIPSGSAKPYGSLRGFGLTRPIVGLARTPSGAGYRMVASDGGIFTFGDAKFLGSRAPAAARVVGLSVTPSGGGYWIAAADGSVRGFGTVATQGLAARPLASPAIGVAGTAADGWHTLLAAGDVALCSSPRGDAATAKLLDGLEGTLAGLGDLQQDQGTAKQFAQCFSRAWSRHKARLRPAVGNHEYETPGALPYYDYFGTAAGPRSKGWYRYSIGGWTILALNSNCEYVGCGPGSEQLRWLEAQLKQNATRCTLAYWHHPRFSSGYFSTDRSAPFWDVLYRYGADVILNGHEHVYDRYQPMAPDGTVDLERGIRQFIVGTGGMGRQTFNVIHPASVIRNKDTFGILQLQLRDGAYTWRFVPEAGKTFTDSGSATCH